MIKCTTYLESRDVQKLFAAGYASRDIGAPFDTLLTINLEACGIAPLRCHQAWSKMLQAIKRLHERFGLLWAFLWVMENSSANGFMCIACCIEALLLLGMVIVGCCSKRLSCRAQAKRTLILSPSIGTKLGRKILNTQLDIYAKASGQDLLRNSISNVSIARAKCLTKDGEFQGRGS